MQALTASWICYHRVVPSSSPQPRLYIASCFEFGRLGFLTFYVQLKYSFLSHCGQHTMTNTGSKVIVLLLLLNHYWLIACLYKSISEEFNLRKPRTRPSRPRAEHYPKTLSKRFFIFWGIFEHYFNISTQAFLRHVLALFSTLFKYFTRAIGKGE